MARKKVITVSFKVTMTLPQGANIKDAQEFIRNGIHSEVGAVDHHSNYMSNLDRDTVKVALMSSHTDYMV